MKILYGVNGEGMGHATRSQVVIDELLDAHDVRVAASGAAFDYLQDSCRGSKEVFGPSFALEDGRDPPLGDGAPRTSATPAASCRSPASLDRERSRVEARTS